MQKISESVQEMQFSSPDKAAMSPSESTKSPHVAQSTPELNSNNVNRLQDPDKYSSSISPLQHSKDATGYGFSRAPFYFGLQVVCTQNVYGQCKGRFRELIEYLHRLASITLAVQHRWPVVSVTYVVGQIFCALLAAGLTRTLFAGK
jgi:hypothetical protein